MLYPYTFKRMIEQKGWKGDKAAGVITCVILLFFMALRGNTVGVDTKYYCNAYVQFADIPWKNLFTATLYGTETGNSSFTLNFEPGYRILNKLLSCAFSSPQTITIANSILIILLLYRFVQTDSPMILLSLWLYLTLGIYQTEMNVSRNAIAILICYLALRWIQRKQPLQYILCILLAAMIHQTALFFLPLYWLVNYIKLTGRKMLTMVLCFSVFGLNFGRIGGFFQQFLPDRYARYLIGEDFSISSILVGVFCLLLYLLIWFLMDADEHSRSITELPIGYWMFALNLCFFGLNLGIEAGARIAALFGPYIICFIPQLLERINDLKRRASVTRCIVVISFLQFAARLMINNIGGTMPYCFFWS